MQECSLWGALWPGCQFMAYSHCCLSYRLWLSSPFPTVNPTCAAAGQQLQHWVQFAQAAAHQRFSISGFRDLAVV